MKIRGDLGRKHSGHRVARRQAEDAGAGSSGWADGAVEVGGSSFCKCLSAQESEDVEEGLEVGGEKRISNRLGEKETRVRTQKNDCCAAS